MQKSLDKIISDHPEGGIIASIVASIAPYLDFLTSFGKFLAVYLGIVVAGATAYIKIKEAIKLRNRSRKDKRNGTTDNN